MFPKNPWKFCFMSIDTDWFENLWRPFVLFYKFYSNISKRKPIYSMNFLYFDIKKRGLYTYICDTFSG